MNQNILHVCMFGNFSLRYGDQQISCDNKRSKQIWSILAYLIYNRGKIIPSEELLNLIWGSEKSDNPQGAMRTAIHRIRSLLESMMPEFGRSLLLYKKGGYVWNPDVEIELDVYEFEKTLTEVNGKNEDSDLERYLAAFNLYEGMFLSMQSSDVWVMPVQAYYHNLYKEIIGKMMPMFEKNGRYEQAMEICRRALQIDPYAESVYQYLMRFLICVDRRQEVVTVYEEMRKILLTAFGVMPDPESRALYREALQTVNNRILSPEMLMEQLNEDGEINGALICDYDFFRMLYQAQARMIVRTGDAVHIALITLNSQGTKNVSQKSMELAMTNLEAHMSQILRKGDVISRCSMSQFIIMLPKANYENSCMVCRRIVSAFERKYPHSPVILDFCVNSIMPSTLS